MTSGEIIYPEEVEYVLVPVSSKSPRAKIHMEMTAQAQGLAGPKKR